MVINFIKNNLFLVLFIIAILSLVLYGNTAYAATKSEPDVILRTNYSYLLYENGKREYHVEINTNINWTSVQGAKDALTKALPGEAVIIYLDSPGGSMSAAESLIDALRDTRAGVVEMRIKRAASAAALIAVYGDVIRVSSSSKMMFHTMSYCNPIVNPNNPREVIHQDCKRYSILSTSNMGIKTDLERYRQMMYHAPLKLLTNEEIDGIFVRWDEIWLMGDEIKQRLIKSHKPTGDYIGVPMQIREAELEKREAKQAQVQEITKIVQPYLNRDVYTPVIENP